MHWVIKVCRRRKSSLNLNVFPKRIKPIPPLAGRENATYLKSHYGAVGPTSAHKNTEGLCVFISAGITRYFAAQLLTG